MSSPAEVRRPLRRSAWRCSGLMMSSDGGRGRGRDDAVSVTKRVSRGALDGAVGVSFGMIEKSSDLTCVLGKP